VAAMTRVPKASERPGSSKSRMGLSEHREARIAQIGDQHGGRRMRDTEWWLGILDRKLRRQPAGPEHRHLALAHIAVADILITLRKVNADRTWISDMHRCAVHVGKARRDLDRTDGVSRF